jgi:hypothetical protein
VTRPQDAVQRAREAVTEKRARGAYPPAETAAARLDEAVAPEQVDAATLREWALIEVDRGAIYSTRRFGGPITFVKRVLLRLLRQYTADLEARQTRFNVAALGRLQALEARIAALERERRG